MSAVATATTAAAVATTPDVSKLFERFALYNDLTEKISNGTITMTDAWMLFEGKISFRVQAYIDRNLPHACPLRNLHALVACGGVHERAFAYVCDWAGRQSDPPRKISQWYCAESFHPDTKWNREPEEEASTDAATLRRLLPLRALPGGHLQHHHARAIAVRRGIDPSSAGLEFDPYCFVDEYRDFIKAVATKHVADHPKLDTLLMVVTAACCVRMTHEQREIFALLAAIDRDLTFERLFPNVPLDKHSIGLIERVVSGIFAKIAIERTSA